MIGTNIPLKQTWIQSKLDELSLEQKIGQMIIGGVHGTALRPKVADMLRRGHLGGVMLIGANIETPMQTRELIQDLQRIAAADTGLPLFIGVDQEGGAVSRLKAPATLMPSQMAFGAAGSISNVEACARAMARELRALGVNLNFAPVLDVNTEPRNPVIGARSFGDSAALVAAMGAAAIKGFRDGGVITTAKHFPGHGHTDIDSHLSMPVITRGRKTLESVELVPFRAAITAGVDIIMSAHAVYPALTAAHTSATMSPEILIDLLRRKLGFRGVVVTDALVMEAIAEHHTLAEAALFAVLAGADVVLTLGTMAEQVEVFHELLRAVKAGEIATTAIDAAVARILALKARIIATQPDGLDGMVFASGPLEEHQKMAEEVARDSITLVKNEGGLLPLRLRSGQRLGIVEFAPCCLSPVEDCMCQISPLNGFFHERHQDVHYVRFDVAPESVDAQLRGLIEESDVIVVATRNAHLVAEQAALVRLILQSGRPTVILALRNPYDIMAFPSVASYVVSYGDAPISMKAAVDLIFGDRTPKGKLPVNIPHLFLFGHGLETFGVETPR